MSFYRLLYWRENSSKAWLKHELVNCIQCYHVNSIVIKLLSSVWNNGVFLKRSTTTITLISLATCHSLCKTEFTISKFNKIYSNGTRYILKYNNNIVENIKRSKSHVGITIKTTLDRDNINNVHEETSPNFFFYLKMRTTPISLNHQFPSPLVDSSRATNFLKLQ